MAKTRESRKHYDTPTKSKIKRAVAERQLNHVRSLGGTKQTQTLLFKEKNVPRGSIDHIIKATSSCRLYNDSDRREIRGRKSKLNQRDLRAYELLIQRNSYDGRVLTQNKLAFKVDLPISGYTLQRHLSYIGYRHCIAYHKGWIDIKIATLRVKFAKEILTKYPNPTDWRKVRFSDEVYLEFGLQSRVYVTRKLGESICPNYIQYKNEPRKQDEKKVHAQRAVGYCQIVRTSKGKGC